MNKDQFIRGLAEAKGITIKGAKESVNNVLEYIEEVLPLLEDGEKLDLTGYLQFEVKDVPQRTARNPQTGEEVEKEATRKVIVRPMTRLKKSVKGE